MNLKTDAAWDDGVDAKEVGIEAVGDVVVAVVESGDGKAKLWFLVGQRNRQWGFAWCLWSPEVKKDKKIVRNQVAEVTEGSNRTLWVNCKQR